MEATACTITVHEARETWAPDLWMEGNLPVLRGHQARGPDLWSAVRPGLLWPHGNAGRRLKVLFSWGSRARRGSRRGTEGNGEDPCVMCST
jgi:hypothetical protein